MQEGLIEHRLPLKSTGLSSVSPSTWPFWIHDTPCRSDAPRLVGVPTSSRLDGDGHPDVEHHGSNEKVAMENTPFIEEKIRPSFYGEV